MKIAMSRKNKFYSLVICITLLFTACGGNKKGSSGSSDDLNTIKIDFAKVAFPMPGNYKQYQPNEILEKLAKEGEEGDKDFIVNGIRSLADNSRDFILLHDENEPTTYIHIEPKEYMELSKTSSEMILAIMKSNIKNAFENTGVAYSFLDQKYIGGKTAQIMKAKFELSLGPIKMWITEYVVSARDKTMHITHHTMYPEDIEDNIKGMKLY